ncbi:MAG: hypothetical protein WD942_02795 [Dehalococcoidia bacterium]
MDRLEARVQDQDGVVAIVIDVGDEEVRIPISEDKPGAVKRAFNRLLLRIKKGAVEVQLEGDGEDPFTQVAKEYLRQLNREVQEIRSEMEEHGLTEARDGENEEGERTSDN